MKENDKKFLEKYGESYENLHIYKRRALQNYGFREFERDKDILLDDFEKEYFGIGSKILFLIGEQDEFSIFYTKMNEVFGSKFRHLKEEKQKGLFEFGFTNIYKAAKDTGFLNENDEIVSSRGTCFSLGDLLWMLERNGIENIKEKSDFRKKYDEFLSYFGNSFYKMSDDRIEKMIKIGFDKIKKLYEKYIFIFNSKDFVNFFYDIIEDINEKDEIQMNNLEKIVIDKNKEFVKEMLNGEKNKIIEKTKESLKDLYHEVQHIKKHLGYEFEKNNRKFLDAYGLRFSQLYEKDRNELILFGFDEFIELREKKRKEFGKFIYENSGSIYHNFFKELFQSKEEHDIQINYNKYFKEYGMGFSNAFEQSEFFSKNIKFEEFQEKVGRILKNKFGFREKYQLFNCQEKQLNKITEDGYYFECKYCKGRHKLNEENIQILLDFGELSCRKERPDLYKKQNRSFGEIKLFEFCKSYLQLKIREIEHNKRILGKVNGEERKKELDVYIDKEGKGLEFNGIYYHQNDLLGQKEKRKFFNDLGINVFFVWEDLWRSKREQYEKKIKNFLGGNKHELLSPSVRRIEKEIGIKFIEKNELKIEKKFGSEFIGLYNYGKLRKVINFDINSEGILEIIYDTQTINYNNSLRMMIMFLLESRHHFYNGNKKLNFHSIRVLQDNEFGSGYEFINIGFKKIGEIESKKIFIDQRDNRYFKENEYNFYEIYDYGFTIFELKV